MSRLWRYLFVNNSFMTLMGASILIIAIWLTQSLRFIDYVMTRGLTVPMFLKLSSFLIPSLVSTILPIAFFIATLFLLSKYYTDHELIVMRSLGFSNVRIMNPFLAVAGVVVTVLFAVNFYVYPMAAKEFRELRDDIRTNISGRWVQPGTFQDIAGVTFYTKHKTRSGDMRGIFVHDTRDPKNTSTITAELGRIVDANGGLRLILLDGTRQSTDQKTGKPNIITFDKYSLDVANPHAMKRSGKRPNELSLGELFSISVDKTSDPDLKTKTFIEAHERILMPLVVFPLCLLAGLAFLLGDYNRRGKTKRVTIAIICALIIELCLFTLINSFEKAIFLIPLTYGLIACLTAFCFYLLVKPSKIKRLHQTSGESN